MPLRHRFFQLMLLILSLYMVHAHYSELNATYAYSQPSQCLYYVIMRIIGAAPCLFPAKPVPLLRYNANYRSCSYNSHYNVIKALAWLGIKSICRIKLTVVSVHHI